MDEPQYLPMGARAWLVWYGEIDLDCFNHSAGSVVRATCPAKVTPIFLPSTKLYPIEDEL